MHAVIHSLFSPDLYDLEHGAPDDLECFELGIMVDIGWVNSSGTDVFTFRVCTPKWLAGQLEMHPYLLGRHFIIVPRYEWSTILKALTDICDAATGDGWDDIASYIARHGLWEFEDIKEFEGNKE